MLNLEHNAHIRDGNGHVFIFPFAKLQVFLYAKLSTASLVTQPSLRKIVLLLLLSRTDHFKLRTL